MKLDALTKSVLDEISQYINVMMAFLLLLPLDNPPFM